MIDISNLTSLITAFRNETEKDSISPETLGALLQAIANELGNVTTDADVQLLESLYKNMLRMGTCITNLAQGSADRNNILVNFAFFNPTSGLSSSISDSLFIKQATTERAGAMRAQQVIDLNAAKKNISTLQDELTAMQTTLNSASTHIDSGKIHRTPIYIETIADRLYISGEQTLVSNGYVPYLFRWTNRKNRIRLSKEESYRGERRKGWHLMGRAYAVKIIQSQVCFSNAPHEDWHYQEGLEQYGYAHNVELLADVHNNSKGVPVISYGSRPVKLIMPDSEERRLVKLRYAIGFAAPFTSGRASIKLSDLVSTLAEFSVVHSPDGSLTFSK